MKPKKPLIIKDPDSQNIIGNKGEQTKLITNHLQKSVLYTSSTNIKHTTQANE